MNCPFCESESIVRETRVIDDGRVIVRRRECANGHRFRTSETAGQLLVSKEGEYAEPFDLSKLARSIEPALYKRMPTRLVGKLALEVAKSVRGELIGQLRDRESGEFDRREIGLLVLDELASKDWLGWLRYLTVFMEEKDGITDDQRRTAQEKIRALLDPLLKPPDPQQLR